jgi:hypothetical protein
VRLSLLRDWLRRWEAPFSLENFLAWTIEPHHVVPALLDRQTVWNVAIAAAELDGNRTIGAILSSNVVDRVSIQLVLLEKAFLIVATDGPEPSTGTSLTTSL